MQALIQETKLEQWMAGDPSTNHGASDVAHNIFTTPWATLYPLYVQKVERKSRSKKELDAVITWLTGYTVAEAAKMGKAGADVQEFFAKAPSMNPNRSLVTGVVCGVRIEELEDPLMREIRILDKLVDELARGRAMEKILRVPK